jgi:hypothetical protein
LVEVRTLLERRIAPILMAVEPLGLWFSVSDEEGREGSLLGRSPRLGGGGEFLLPLAEVSGVRERRLGCTSSSRSGEESESDDEENMVVVGGGGMDADSGETSLAFLERKPALKRLFVGWAKDASGDGGMGEELSSPMVLSAEKLLVRSEICGTVSSAVLSSGGEDDGIC